MPLIQGYDPRTGKPAGDPVAETTDDALDRLILTADDAAGPWGQASRATRARALGGVADALDARAADLVAIADTETALGLTRLTGEVARTTGQLRLFREVLTDGGYQDVMVSPSATGVPGLSRIKRPIGPVAVFAASNFPFAFSVAGGDTASALAAGCPVVLKAREGGTFAVVQGVPAGIRLLKHPAIRRWLIPVAYQDFPAALLPETLRDPGRQATQDAAS